MHFHTASGFELKVSPRSPLHTPPSLFLFFFVSVASPLSGCKWSDNEVALLPLIVSFPVYVACTALPCARGFPPPVFFTLPHHSCWRDLNAEGGGPSPRPSPFLSPRVISVDVSMLTLCLTTTCLAGREHMQEQETDMEGESACPIIEQTADE
jgi:hypothetical protein